MTLKGLGASAGQVTGKARVLRSLADLASLEAGEVMVCEETSPDWVVGFLKATAIVTATGGITCHAAVVSREMKLPAVVGVPEATDLIKTGDLLEVNGLTGEVRVG